MYKRDGKLPLLENYDGLPYLRAVIVVWNDIERALHPASSLRIHVPVYYVNGTQNSLNNRFLPIDLIRTDAVFSMDDDFHAGPNDILFAYRYDETYIRHRTLEILSFESLYLYESDVTPNYLERIQRKVCTLLQHYLLYEDPPLLEPTDTFVDIIYFVFLQGLAGQSRRSRWPLRSTLIHSSRWTGRLRDESSLRVQHGSHRSGVRPSEVPAGVHLRHAGGDS